MPTREEVLGALSHCLEPELRRDIVSLGMVKNLVIDQGRVAFDYVLTTPACPLKSEMEQEARAALLKLPGVKEVRVNMVADVKKDPRLANLLPPGIKNVVAVGSGKGGVGKSTVAANIAVSLALDGAAVGLMDADIYGPNQPQMLGLPDFEPKVVAGNKIVPAEAHDIKLMSMGFLTEPDSPVIWRGPMLHSAVTQFLKDVVWGDLDYLVIDLPPGTGDVQLSLCQAVPLAGAVLVTTPQTIAVADVRKAAAMFDKLKTPLLGIVENMADFICPHCKKPSAVFSSGGADQIAGKYKIPVLGRVPLDMEVCRSGESGAPIVASRPASPTAEALRAISRRVAAQISVAASKIRPLEIKIAAAA